MNITDVHEMIADVGKYRGEMAQIGRQIDLLMQGNPEDAIDVQIEEQEAWEAEQAYAIEQQNLDKWGV